MTQQAESSPWISLGSYTIHEDYHGTSYIKALTGRFKVVIPTIVTMDSTSKPINGEFVCFFDTLEEAQTFFLKFKEEGAKHKLNTE